MKLRTIISIALSALIMDCTAITTHQNLAPELRYYELGDYTIFILAEEEKAKKTIEKLYAVFEMNTGIPVRNSIEETYTPSQINTVLKSIDTNRTNSDGDTKIFSNEIDISYDLGKAKHPQF